MTRALLVALWCAAVTTVAGARYGDYSGIRMPQYGAPDYDAREPLAPAPEPDDYRGHSPDAPAALDYKYEQELAGALGKTEQTSIKEEKKEVEETDSWQRPVRKHRRKSNRAVSEDRRSADALNRFDPEDDFPKAKSSSRFTKHRPRLKSRRYGRTDEDTHDYSHRDKRVEGDMLDNEDLDFKSGYRNDKRNNMDDRSRSGHRVVRRKPRDKLDNESERHSMEKAESDLDRWMMMRGELGHPPMPEPFPSSDEEVPLNRRPDNPIRDMPMRAPPPKSGDEEDEPLPPARATQKGSKGKKGKNDDDYNDYYDMKRVMNIKKKLPSLLRRTTVDENLIIKAPGPPLPAAPARDPGLSRSLQELLSNRRMFLPPPSATRKTEAPDISVTTSITTTRSTTTVHHTTAVNTTKNGTELSLAEKSRLSILKKAMKKESMGGGFSTKKPPVLLQVTKQMPTVVMVEPPSSEPFLRAREVYADSPSRLDKVKRLMRHKLVVNAKNIHDLTDNWDDLVCDYIDMSLIDSLGGATQLGCSSVLLFFILVFVFVW